MEKQNEFKMDNVFTITLIFCIICLIMIILYLGIRSWRQYKLNKQRKMLEEIEEPRVEGPRFPSYDYFFFKNQVPQYDFVQKSRYTVL